MLEARDIEGRHKRSGIFDIERGFGVDAVLGEILVDGRT